MDFSISLRCALSSAIFVLFLSIFGTKKLNKRQPIHNWMLETMMKQKKKKQFKPYHKSLCNCSNSHSGMSVSKAVVTFLFHTVRAVSFCGNLSVFRNCQNDKFVKQLSQFSIECREIWGLHGNLNAFISYFWNQVNIERRIFGHINPDRCNSLVHLQLFESSILFYDINNHSKVYELHLRNKKWIFSASQERSEVNPKRQNYIGIVHLERRDTYDQSSVDVDVDTYNVTYHRF